MKLEDVEVFGERLFEVDDSGRVVAKDGVGITPGIDPAMWLGDQREKRPHWFPGNVGGGSGGGVVVNPPPEAPPASAPATVALLTPLAAGGSSSGGAPASGL